jgi:F-type H+-transporting ATPase subunit b
MLALLNAVPLAVEENGGNFLVTPNVGLMIWTVIAFVATMLVLRKFAFPRIQRFLDDRQHAIERTLDEAAAQRREAEQLLGDYRERLREARAQAEEIIMRSRRAAEETQRESLEAAREQRAELLAQTRKDVEAEARRALQQLRDEVAALTVLATEKVTRKTLTQADQKRLVAEALSELDFSSLSGASAQGNGKRG